MNQFGYILIVTVLFILIVAVLTKTLELNQKLDEVDDVLNSNNSVNVNKLNVNNINKESCGCETRNNNVKTKNQEDFQLYGPAKMKHAHPGKKGELPEVIPNYPVPTESNQLEQVRIDQFKDVAKYMKCSNDSKIDNYYYVNKEQIKQDTHNDLVGHPVIGKPTKTQYEQEPLGAEKQTEDLQAYKSYDNVMYMGDVKKQLETLHSNNAGYYAVYDNSPIMGCN